MTVDREATPVLYVACADEVAEIRAAWERLEAVVPLKGRRFFGAAYADGTYRRERLRGEPPEIYDRIPGVVEALGAGDSSRPVIEHYRRRDEIDVLLPVR